MPITVQSNTTVTFSCLAWSFGGLIYKWTRTGNSTLDLPHSSSVFFNNKQLPADAKYSTTVYELQILNVQVTDGVCTVVKLLMNVGVLKDVLV